MDPIIIAIISVGLLILFIMGGVHVGIAMAALSLVGVYWITGSFSIAMKLLGSTSYEAVMDYFFGAAPMFILMGLLANQSGASTELYNSVRIVFARLRGGIAIATVFANAIFAAVTGVSLASIAVFSKISVPQMKRLGYDHRFSIGTVAGSSVLGMLIPPSVLLIYFGILAEESIGALFIAGVIPGIILSFVYAGGIMVMVQLKPHLVGETPPVEELETVPAWKIVLAPWACGVLIVLVLGGIYAGFFTPTEAGAVGAFGALIITLAKRRMTWPDLWRIMVETGYSTGSIYLLFIAARMYSRMLAISGMPAETAAFATSLNVPPLVIVGMFLLIFIILGAILDSVSILVVCIPLMIPVIHNLDLNVIWFGIIAIVAVEMGLLTPPFGMAAFAMNAIIPEHCSVEDVYVGSLPFLIMMLFVLLLLVFFPPLILWLPSLM